MSVKQLVNPPGVKLLYAVKIFPFKSLKYLEVFQNKLTKLIVTFVALFCIIVLNIAFLFDCFSVQLKRIPPHCLEGLRGVYSQLEVFTCSKGVSSLEVMVSPTGIGTVTISLTMFIYRK